MNIFLVTKANHEISITCLNLPVKITVSCYIQIPIVHHKQLSHYYNRWAEISTTKQPTKPKPSTLYLNV